MARLLRYDPDKHHRRSIRLKNYDYAQPGAYFVTICTHNRECILGEVSYAGVRLNAFGEIVQACWRDLPAHYPHVILDIFVVMPNHVHSILVLSDVGGGSPPRSTTPGRGDRAPTGDDAGPDSCLLQIPVH